MIGIKCLAALYGVSGHSEWARHYILALIKHGVPITIGVDTLRNTGQPIIFEPNMPDLGEDRKILEQFVNKKIDYDVVISWLTPEITHAFMQQETGVKKINMSLWESDQLPYEWSRYFLDLDEVWVPGEWNKKIYSDSLKEQANNYAFKKLSDLPIRSIPLPLQAEKYYQEYDADYFFEDRQTFYFYCISQWNKRKNFEDLITAYCLEFDRDEKVALVLKTYMFNGSDQDRQQTLYQINSTIEKLGKKDLPPIMLIHGNYSKLNMLQLHRSCDCYVSSAHGEGLGLGMLEATMAGNAVIYNTFGEQQSFLNPSFSFPYDHDLIPVSTTGHMNKYIDTLFTNKGRWASPKIPSLQKTMRTVFALDETQLAERTREAKRYIMGLYDDKKIVNLILEALQ